MHDPDVSKVGGINDEFVASSSLSTRAWELSYLDPVAARALGMRIVNRRDDHAGAGWLHVALAEVRIGDEAVAEDALRRARAALLDTGDETGLILCDEVEAIALRRRHENVAAAALQQTIDEAAPTRDAMHGFIAHNSRAVTAIALGDPDGALQHMYIASDYADRTGWAGPKVTATSNLGGYHVVLFNLEDARSISERALKEARENQVRPIIGSAAANLIIVYCALGESMRARDMVEYMVTHEHELMPGALSRHALPLAQGHLAVGEIDAALGYLEAGPIAGVSNGDGVTQWTWLKSRCLLANGDPTGALQLARSTLFRRQEANLSDQAYDLMELYRVLSDASEATGDNHLGLHYVRLMHFVYEQLVGRSARARFKALEVTHRLAQAQSERDQAVLSQQAVEDVNRNLEHLNRALQAQIAKNDLLHAKLREQALRDPLTGLHNRRFLFEAAPGLLELSRRQGANLCLAMIDLDRFKSVNDTYGHDAGDFVLQRFSTLIKGMLRGSDLIVRHGGEEFVVVMPDTDDIRAQTALSKVLETFRSQRSDFGQHTLEGISFSAGIALYQRDGGTLEQLLSRADVGLYTAKTNGRARIEIARTDPPLVK